MSQPARERITEVVADERGRVAIGRAGVHRNDRFFLSRTPAGEIVLTPVASIPKRELIVWENDDLRASILQGLADFASGRVEPLDDWVADGDDEASS